MPSMELELMAPRSRLACFSNSASQAPQLLLIRNVNSTNTFPKP